ncbi:hypothetical protein J6590_029823 [Homalodisca vitripennis]|nr:hypothetical protein J6590_029823 [Homalodisca vitripennis]
MINVLVASTYFTSICRVHHTSEPIGGVPILELGGEVRDLYEFPASENLRPLEIPVFLDDITSQYSVSINLQNCLCGNRSSILHCMDKRTITMCVVRTTTTYHFTE